MKFRAFWPTVCSAAFGGLAVFKFGMGEYLIAGFDTFFAILYLVLALTYKEKKENDQSSN